MYIHGQDLLNLDSGLFVRATSNPTIYLPRLDAALAKAAKLIGGEGADVEHLRLRISHLPSIPFFERRTAPRSEDTGRIVQFRGTVTKTKQKVVLWWRRHMVCQSCRESSPLEGDYDQFYRIDVRRPPCPSEGCPGVLGQAVPQAPEDCRDMQDVKVQERPNARSLGSVPQSLWVTLEDELVDSVRSGDDVELIGVIRRRWHPLGEGAGGRTEVELWMQANSVRVVNRSESNRAASEEAAAKFEEFWRQPGHADLAGRDIILSHFCTEMFGLHRVKLALAVVLAGGVERVDGEGTRVRGEPHLLLVGDPGTGKSQLLRYCSSLMPRSVVANGAGSSSAGLTVAASRLVVANSLTPRMSVAFAGTEEIGSWTRGPWCWQTEASAASTTLASSRRKTGRASTRPWSNRPSPSPRPTWSPN